MGVGILHHHYHPSRESWERFNDWSEEYRIKDCYDDVTRWLYNERGAWVYIKAPDGRWSEDSGLLVSCRSGIGTNFWSIACLGCWQELGWLSHPISHHLNVDAADNPQTCINRSNPPHRSLTSILWCCIEMLFSLLNPSGALPSACIDASYFFFAVDVSSLGCLLSSLR